MQLADLGAELSKTELPCEEDGSPWQFSETPAKIGIAPALGEHNGPILTRLGYTEAQTQELKKKNVI